MANDFTLGVGQAHELDLAMKRAGGWNGALVKALSTGNRLTDVRDVLLGRAEIRPIENLIDCDVEPACPEGYTVEHKGGGNLKWEEWRVDLYRSQYQTTGDYHIQGHDLRKELEGKPVLNACVLDFLLANPALIPSHWKAERLFFWGSVYRRITHHRRGGTLYIRYLYWNRASHLDGRWQSSQLWLGTNWGLNDPAAVLT